MAVVGDAFVRVRVISSGLSNDISDAVKDGFRRASGDIDNDSEAAGRRAGRATASGIRTEASKGAKETGERVAEDLETNFRTRLLRDIRKQLPLGLKSAFRDSFKRGLSGLTPEKDFDFNAFQRAGRDLSKSLSNGFSLGIGRARMGKAVLSALLLASPSLISGAAAIGGAMASELITFISAIGPGVAGALGVAAAGFSSLALNAGLLFAAFKSGNAELDAAKSKLADVGKALGAPIASGMVAGFSAFVDSLQSILPQINDLLADTGTAFGEVFKKIGDTVSSAENLARIRAILSTNLTFIHNFGDGLAGLTTSFLVLFAASKPFIDYVGAGIKQFGEWAAASLTAAEANGSLATFMQNMLDKFKQLASIVADFGVGIYNVFKSASDAGQGLLDRIAGIGQRFRDWTGDDANQKRMSEFFSKMDVLAHAVFETIGKLFQAFGSGLENVNLQPILDFLTTLQNVVGPAVISVFKEIKEGAGPNLAKAFENFGTALQKVAESGMVQKIAEGVSAIVLAATEFINTDFGNAIFSILVPLGLFGGLISTIIGPLSALVEVIGTLSTAGLLPLAATIGAIVGFFVLMYQNSENLRDSLSNMGSVIAEHVGPAFDKIKVLIGPAIDAVVRLASAVGDKLAGAFNFLAPIVGVVIDKIGVVLEFFLKQFTTIINLITDLITGNWAGVWEDFKQIFVNVWDAIVGLFGGLASTVWSWIQGIGSAIATGWNDIWQGVEDIWNTITTYLSTQWNDITSGAKQWISDVGDNISSGFSNVVGWISGAWNTVTTFFSNLWDGIVSGVSTFGGNILSALGTAWDNVISFIQGFGQGVAQVFNIVWEFALIPLKITWNIIKLIWTAISGFLFAVWDKIAAGAEVVWSGITDFFSTVWDGVKDVAETVWNAITGFLSTAWAGIASVASSVWSTITTFFSTVWDGVTEVFTSVWTTITDFLSTSWEGIVSVATTIWSGISNFFSTLWDAFVQITEAAWNTITDFLSTVWAGIQTVASTVWSAISTFFSTIWDGIVTVFTAAVTTIQSWLSAAWDAISSVVSSVWNAISTFFATVWNGIYTTISSVVQTIIDWLSAAWDTITSAVSTAWGAISGLASELWGDVVSAIEDVVRPIVETLQGWWDDITSAVSSAWDGLSGTVGEIWQGIKDAIVQPIADAWNLLVGWASDIAGVIKGIIGGVDSAVTEVNTKIQSMLDTQAAAGANTAGPSGDAGIFGGGAAEGAIVPPIPGGWNMIVGEAGQTERIEPLDRQGLSRRDRALITHLVGQMSSGANQQGSGQVAVSVNLDGALLGRFVESIVVDKQNQAGRRAARNRSA